MAKPIIEAVRARNDIKESVLHTAQEMAHRASIYGVVQDSYTFFAMKCHCCKQTIINHVKILIEKGILRKRTTRIKGKPFCEINVYFFILPWRKPQQSNTTQMCNSKNFLPKLPEQDRVISPYELTSKEGTLEGDLALARRGLTFCEPGTVAYETTCERIACLEGLIKGPDNQMHASEVCMED